MSVLTDFYANANRQMPLRWVSGNAYPLDADVWSAVDGRMYRRIVAGAGATDPSSDTTNWRAIATAGVKSVQRVAIVVGPALTTASAAISSVNPLKATIEIIGQICTGSTFSPAEHQFYPEIVSATSVRVTRYNPSANNVTVHLQIVEWF